METSYSISQSLKHGLDEVEDSRPEKKLKTTLYSEISDDLLYLIFIDCIKELKTRQQFQLLSTFSLVSHKFYDMSLYVSKKIFQEFLKMNRHTPFYKMIHPSLTDKKTFSSINKERFFVLSTRFTITQLDFFGLAKNSDLKGISKNPSLTYLNISIFEDEDGDDEKNIVTNQGFREIANLVNLTFLDVSFQNQITEPCFAEVLAKLKALETLKLRGNLIGNTAIQSLNLTSLKTLQIFRNESIDQMGIRSIVEQNPNITSLTIGDCSKINKEWFSEIGKLPLKELNISRNECIDDLFITSLANNVTQLTHLNLALCSRITKDWFSILKKLPLKNLNISKNAPIKTSDLRAIGINFPLLDSIKMTDCGFDPCNDGGEDFDPAEAADDLQHLNVTSLDLRDNSNLIDNLKKIEFLLKNLPKITLLKVSKGNVLTDKKINNFKNAHPFVTLEFHPWV